MPWLIGVLVLAIVVLITIKGVGMQTITVKLSINVNTPPPPPLAVALPDGTPAQAPPIVNPLADALVGTGYSQQLTISGGTPPDNLTFDPTFLPPGLTLDNTGLISGTPTKDGLYQFDVEVADSSL